VTASRLAENPAVRVLLLEAGGTDEVTSVSEASQWPLNLGGERDWNFCSEPDPLLNGRSIPFSMGKVLGGGSSINLMIWARGHQSDWDQLSVYGIDNLRVADASIMPRITSGNTMAPCVVIGERASQFIKAERRF
jgi:choline dehydrogenase-like flavoprotein